MGRLDRDVTKEELNLIQLAAGQMAQTGPGSSKIVRSEPVDIRARRPRVDRRLDPHRHRNGADVAALPDEIRNDPVLLALLQRCNLKRVRYGLEPPEASASVA